MSIKSSIIIPTFHRKKSLFRLLNSLFKEITNTTEIIIVEQGDNNGEEFREYAKKHHIRLSYIFSSVPNTAQAKNIGAKAAKGTYLIFFDDDVVVHKGIIKNLIKNFADPTVGCVAGRAEAIGQPLEPRNNHVGRVTPWVTISSGYSSLIRQDVDTPIGCNMAFPKEIFDEAGGFDERFTAAIREESDLALRIKVLGYRIVFDPTATVVHLREPIGGGRKSEGRMRWYFHFLSNETYFFLKHGKKIFFLLFFLTRLHWVFRCMFGFGREVSFRSMLTPLAGIADGFKKYRMYLHENRG
jgi:GT2 family glycosyltransferase